MNKIIYLAGPITDCSYKECTNWRNKVSKSLPNYISTISPMRGKEHLNLNNSIIKMSYENDLIASAKGINCRDFNDVKTCDAIFVNFLNAKKISIGTVMEIAWARAFNKPVICIMEKENIHHHSMLDYSCGYIAETLEKGLEIIIKLLSTDQQLESLEINNQTKIEQSEKTNNEYYLLRRTNIKCYHDSRIEEGRLMQGYATKNIDTNEDGWQIIDEKLFNWYPKKCFNMYNYFFKDEV